MLHSPSNFGETNAMFMKGSLLRFLIPVLGLIFTSACSAQQIELRGGSSLFPGMVAGLRYEHYTNSMINVAGGVFVESARRKPLSYSSFGVELLAQYKSDAGEDNSLFAYKLGLGVAGELQSEPWVYKDWPLVRRLNYGVLLDGAVVIHLSEAFGLSALVQQKFLFNKILGTTHFLFGIGLSYHLGL